MASNAAPRRSATATGGDRAWGLLGVSLLAVAVVSAVGSLSTDTGPSSWYAGIEQPSWNPPDSVFGPVWSVLYVLMAVAAWLVAKHGLRERPVAVAVGIYGAQLALNLAWTLVFFGLEAPTAALVVIVALVAAIVATIVRFRRIEPVAAWLLVPYLAWTCYATALNGAIVSLN